MIQLLTGDCRAVLPTLPANSVHCVVTSPPYYGLRDYGTAQWEGGDAGCDHGEAYRKRRNEHRAGDCGDGGIRRSERDPQTGVCSCGARRIDAQIGLEATPDGFIATLVAVFRQIRRVMRDDGTVWLNLGDSYATSPAGNLQPSTDKRGPGSYRRANNAMDTTRIAKPKDLLMMPARVALALQADGWWLRSDIIWAKPNPMPESCRDRPTSAHEHVFLLSKRARYFYDADAVREEAEFGASVPRDGVAHGPYADKTFTNGGFRGGSRAPGNGGTRNLRNVWTIATQPFPQSHFATYPAELVARCIRAGTSERGCCAACGAPWVRVTETEYHQNRTGKTGRKDTTGSNGWDDGTYPNLSKVSTTTGWSPSCQCNAEVVPCTVLDPFSGAGTTALVADRLGRNAIGIDLSHQYVEMSRTRLMADCPLFAELSPPPPQDDAYDREMRDLFAPLAAD